MRPICNFIVFGSTLGALAAVLAGCGDDDSGGGASCAQVCAKVTAAKCDNDPDCMKTCNDVKDSTPMGCTDAYDALTTCYASAKFTCDADEQSVAKECSKQEKAYAECLQSGGKDNGDKDAGDDGSNAGGTNGGGGQGGDGSGGGGPTTLKDAGIGGSGASGNGGSGSGGTTSGNTCNADMLAGCEKCIATSCCDEVVACQSDVDCATLEQCVANCGDSSCVQTCADAASSSAVDGYNMIIDCATNQCDSECADGSTSNPDAGTSAGDPDVGEPNDGNGGHTSTDTPPNCLFVSPDVTGYCEEVKYKVIYDCPDGPPYDDCELNKINSSGIYCCGH